MVLTSGACYVWIEHTASVYLSFVLLQYAVVQASSGYKHDLSFRLNRAFVYFSTDPCHSNSQLIFDNNLHIYCQIKGTNVLFFLKNPHSLLINMPDEICDFTKCLNICEKFIKTKVTEYLSWRESGSVVSLTNNTHLAQSLRKNTAIQLLSRCLCARILCQGRPLPLL